MLGLDLVLRHASLLTIDERSQAHTITGFLIDIELLNKNSGDIGFSQFITLHQCFFTLLITANLQYPAIATNLGRFNCGGRGGGRLSDFRISLLFYRDFLGRSSRFYLLRAAHLIDEALFQLRNSLCLGIELNNPGVELRISFDYGGWRYYNLEFILAHA